jgi:hypothetical protein
VDFSTAASQNGLITVKLSLQKETNIIRKMTKDFLLLSSFIFELSLHKIIIRHLRQVMQTPFCDAAIAKSTEM